jgi:hypothetical protein
MEKQQDLGDAGVFVVYYNGFTKWKRKRTQKGKTKS